MTRKSFNPVINKPINLETGRFTQEYIRYALDVESSLERASGNNGDIQFANNGKLSSDENLAWDNENKYLGLGVSSVTATLDIQGNDGYSQFRLRQQYTPLTANDSNGNEGVVAFNNNNLFYKTSEGWKFSRLVTVGDAYLNFIELGDTPPVYTDNGDLLAVNETRDGLQFISELSASKVLYDNSNNHFETLGVTPTVQEVLDVLGEQQGAPVDEPPTDGGGGGGLFG